MVAGFLYLKSGKLWSWISEKFVTYLSMGGGGEGKIHPNWWGQASLSFGTPHPSLSPAPLFWDRGRLDERKEEELSLQTRRSHSLCRRGAALQWRWAGWKPRLYSAFFGCLYSPGCRDLGPPRAPPGGPSLRDLFCSHSEEPRWKQGQSRIIGLRCIFWENMQGTVLAITADGITSMFWENPF